MLGKLIKQELKATARLLLPIYIVLVVLTILDRIVLGFDIFDGAFKLIPGTITIAYVVSIFAMTILTTVIVIFRFYKNMVTDEGYLMFTLPAKPSQLINSKLIVACLWILSSVVAIIGSILIVLGTLEEAHSFWTELPIAWAEFQKLPGAVPFVVYFIVLIFISLFCTTLQIYASIAIGQLFNGHKILGSVVAYAVTYFIMQFVSVAVLVGTGFASGRMSNDFRIVSQVFMPATLVMFTLFTIAYYLITNFIFNKKLNLE